MMEELIQHRKLKSGLSMAFNQEVKRGSHGRFVKHYSKKYYYTNIAMGLGVVIAYILFWIWVFNR